MTFMPRRRIFNGLQLTLATVFLPTRSTVISPAIQTSPSAPPGVLGFRLMENFEHPLLFAVDFRILAPLHISLSTWFRDYVYISMGGSRVVKSRWFFNLMVTLRLAACGMEPTGPM